MLTLSTALALLSAAAPAQEAAPAEAPFPASTALAEGVDPGALARLDGLVQGLVDEGEVAGAELLVIKNGHALLHAAYGWSDREARVPMETGSVFCVRSMTKPLVGAAVLMLVDDGELELGDRVAQYLPAFDVEGQRDITVEMLLTHTSGLPMSLLLGKDLRALDGIQAVAALGGECALEFPPGNAFSYSDQGTDTLTALIEVVGGRPAADFVRARVLEPLGMRDSACVLTEDSPLRARALVAYAGSRGEWSRFWGPDEPPLFPFFLGSQGLYATLEDYGRFASLWLAKGRANGRRLLSPRSVRKALTPGPHPMAAPTGFPGLRVEYGYLMQLWTREDADGESEVVVFGHTGSDGTHAWVFPEQDAIALYFTQSRNNSTGLRVEEALGEVFLGAPFDPNQVAPPFEEYLGYYWEGEDDLYRAIVRDGDDLALEILGKAVVPLTYLGQDRWKFRPNPSIVLAFDRSPEGAVTGYHIGEHQEFRFEPAPDLPGADEIAERVARAHRVDLLESLGPLHMEGALTIEKLGIEGRVTALYAWPDRYRIETAAGEELERVTCDGEQVQYASRLEPAAVVEGLRAEQLRLDSLLVRFGDWRRSYPRLQVIQRLQKGSEAVLIVRAGDTTAPAPTMYVQERTGLLGRQDSMVNVPGMGRIGQQVEFGDFRDVSGMTLPFRSEVVIANPMLGAIVTTIAETELGGELPADAFELAE